MPIIWYMLNNRTDGGYWQRRDGSDVYCAVKTCIRLVDTDSYLFLIYMTFTLPFSLGTE